MLSAVQECQKNIIRAVENAKNKGIYVVTLSGFNEKNDLRKLGNLNFYVNSNEYGFVEILHLVLIHTALDLFIKK